MRLLKRLPEAVAAVTVLGFASCAKVGPSGANGLTGPAGPSYSNVVVMGHVSLYDVYGAPATIGLSTVQISLNSGTSIYPDSSGFFEYQNLTTGNYQLAATDSGYAANRVGPFQAVLDTVYRNITLSAIPTFNPVAIGVASESEGFSVTVTYPNDARARAGILFVYSDSTVSNLISGYKVAYTTTFAGNTATFTIFNQDLYDIGFVSGSKVYVAGYSYAVGDHSVYVDQTSGKTVYNAVGATRVLDSLITP